MERERRSWRLAGAFDAGHIRGGAPDWQQELNFHQLEISGHARQLEDDYKLFREVFGLREFRDGAWLAYSFPQRGEFRWDYLDRLAALSNGTVHLSLCHYEWPIWLDPSEALTGSVIEPMAEFASAVAKRYRGLFAAYIPAVETGYWTAMISDWGRWWPSTRAQRAGTWGEVFAVIGKMLVRMGLAIRAADPDTPIELSEPWAWHPDLTLEAQSRPFQTLTGKADPEFGGRPDLLQIAGLNFYNNWGVEQGWPLSRLLLEARGYFPTQKLIMGETGNCHFSDCHTVSGWLELIDEQVEIANAQGANVEVVTWAPILTLGDFDWGRPAPGAWVTWDPDDPTRKRIYDPNLPQQVQPYT